VLWIVLDEDLWRIREIPSPTPWSESPGGWWFEDLILRVEDVASNVVPGWMPASDFEAIDCAL